MYVTDFLIHSNRLEALSATNDEEAFTQVNLLEFRLLYLFIKALREPPASSGLVIQLRDPPAAVLVSEKGDLFCNSESKMGMVLMSDMKTALAQWGSQKGWPDELATKAIYALVAKALLKIDRRTREACIFFDPQ